MQAGDPELSIRIVTAAAAHDQIDLNDRHFVRLDDAQLNAALNEPIVLTEHQPFVWQAYPQDDGAHGPKIEAFLGLALAGAPTEAAEAIRDWTAAWNVAIWATARASMTPSS